MIKAHVQKKKKKKKKTQLLHFSWNQWQIYHVRKLYVKYVN